MIVTKKAIHRRTVLRGLGTTIALPLLDGMIPALSALAKTAGNPVRRFDVVYVAHGASPGYWLPKAEGTEYELTLPLKPLERFKDRFLLLSGIDNVMAMARDGEPRGGHGRMAPAFMCGVHAKPTQGADFEAGISIDQIAANHVGRETQLPSLELSLEPVEFSGTCDSGYSCVYTNTLSWRSPTMALPMESNPRAVFERLFGDSGSTDAALRLARIQEKRSILDSVLASARGLKGQVGAADRGTLDEYLGSIRDVERRLQIAEAQSDRELPVVAQPAAAPDDYVAYAKLMFDLQVLAYQADLTRVSAFMLCKELNGRTYPDIGVSEGHHSLSHHGDNAEKKAQLAQVNAYHASLFAYLLERMQATPDGDGSLLDHSIVLYGSGQGDPNLHEPKELPIIVAGGGAGRLEGGRHIRYASHPELSNLHVTLLNKFGVPVESVGDSTGQLPLEPLSGV